MLLIFTSLHLQHLCPSAVPLNKDTEILLTVLPGPLSFPNRSQRDISYLQLSPSHSSAYTCYYCRRWGYSGFGARGSGFNLNTIHLVTAGLWEELF